MRAAALTGTQCASYDAAKQAWMARTGMGDTPVTHLGASMVTGLATTTITAPVDLIKTKMFVGAAPSSCRAACCFTATIPPLFSQAASSMWPVMCAMHACMHAMVAVCMHSPGVTLVE
jgi:hypothetical protein